MRGSHRPVGTVIRSFGDPGGHVPPAVRAVMNDPQVMSSFAMYVCRQDGPGGLPENLNAIVGPPGLSPSAMLAQFESGQGLSQFSVLDTYTLRLDGTTEYGAQSYLAGPVTTVVTTVTSHDAATTEAERAGRRHDQVGLKSGRMPLSARR